MKKTELGGIMTDEEAQLVTTGALGKAIGTIEGYEFYYDIPTIKALFAWHKERLQWCQFVLRGEENKSLDQTSTEE
jgi:hypothetical protein